MTLPASFKSSPGPGLDTSITRRSVARSPTILPMSESATGLWLCESCGFIYDPAEGDPDGGIPEGTRFEDIPDTWFCPVCGARKTDFVPYDG